MIQQSSLY